MIIIFWLLVVIILYTYAGYPLLINSLAKTSKSVVKKKEICPRVSIIISAYNEEKNIKAKLEDTLKLDYPKDKFEVIVASDASSDRTDNIVRQFINKGVSLFRTVDRVGKTELQNQVVNKAKGGIILFSDATTMYSSDTLKKIVSNFSDATVGAVGGELTYLNKNNTAVGEGNSLYWKYEKFLKERESQISSLIGVSGCCYAVRKKLYEPINPGLISDFVIAQMIYKKGKRVVYEPGVVSYEETNITSNDEFKMRVRVVIRTLNALWHMRALLNPFKYGIFAIQMLSHKVLRYSAPIVIISLFFINMLICGNYPFLFYKFSLSLQSLFYLFAILGILFHKKIKYLYIPFYFCVTNFALLVGLFRFLRGERQIIWSPLRK